MGVDPTSALCLTSGSLMEVSHGGFWEDDDEEKEE